MKRLYVFLSLILGMPTLHAENCTAPTHFDVGIGGFFGASFDVKLKKPKQILYLYNPHTFTSAEDTQSHSITVTTAQWKKFCASMDAINIWNWDSSYVDSSVRDGTQWHAEMIFGSKRSLKTSGYNAYPNSQDFGKFLSAVRELTGGREFR